jgi:hypothetical protein
MRIAVFQTFYWTLLVTCINFLAHEEAILFFSILFVAQPGDIISRKSSPELAHVWNKAVDETLGRLVVYLSSRGWWLKHYVEQDMWRRAHGRLWPFSRHCVHMPGMYSTFLYTQSWTSFVSKRFSNNLFIVNKLISQHCTCSPNKGLDSISDFSVKALGLWKGRKVIRQPGNTRKY